MATNASQNQKDPFKQAKSNMEIVGNGIYYAMALSDHLMKLSSKDSKPVVTLEELLEIDFIVGNLLAADGIMQNAQKISA